MDEQNNITVLDQPIEVNTITWIYEHPDCDTVIDQMDNSTITVYAYADDGYSNEALRLFRDENMPTREILKGMTENAIHSIF